MILVNGERRPVVETLGRLLEELGVASRGVAVAVDGEVVPRSQWAQLRLADGARVEVVGASQGG